MTNRNEIYRERLAQLGYVCEQPCDVAVNRIPSDRIVSAGKTHIHLKRTGRAEPHTA